VFKIYYMRYFPQPSSTPPPAAVPDFDVEEEFEDGDGEGPLE
jgi:hypothetical protein